MIKRIDDNPYALIIDGKFGEVFSGENAWDRAKRAADLIFGHVMIVKLMYGSNGSIWQDPREIKKSKSLYDTWESYFRDYTQAPVSVDPIREYPVTPAEAYLTPRSPSISERIEAAVRQQGLNNNEVPIAARRFMGINLNTGFRYYRGEGSADPVGQSNNGLISTIENQGMVSDYNLTRNSLTNTVGSLAIEQASVAQNISQSDWDDFSF